MRSRLRRRALALALVLTASACVAGSGAPLPKSPTGVWSSPPASSQASQLRGFENIQHVIFIVQENRSFDSYFGTFPGADGIPARNGRFTVCVPDPVTGICAPPYHESALVNIGGPHSVDYAVTDVNGGKMDGFIQAAIDSPFACPETRAEVDCLGTLGPQRQPDVMGYHDAREIPNYWTWAARFGLQDRMFAPSDSWTLPSHLFLVSGWSAWCTDAHDPMSCRSDLDQIDSLTNQKKGRHPSTWAWTDITYLLDRAHVSWGYYPREECQRQPCRVAGWTPAQNPLPAFTDVHESRDLDHFHTHQDFLSSLRDGTLPTVS
ncbi:MAG: hypothetical protein HY240_01850 [Actinobacteria bacterium]|nr:hypothetical protein [Actinomycetota bacterium]